MFARTQNNYIKTINLNIKINKKDFKLHLLTCYTFSNTLNSFDVHGYLFICLCV